MTRTLRVTYTPHKKIYAIKFVRELSGLGLKEAKDVVEGDATFTLSSTFDESRLTSFVQEAAREEVHILFVHPSTSTSPSQREAVAAPPSSGGTWALRYHSGPNKIEAIKLARELTGLGLKEAKDLVEQQGLVRDGLSREQAQAMLERFVAVGSLAVLEQGGGARPQLPSPKPGQGGAAAVYGRPADGDDF
jgi:ribosomal protein L7/L12